MKIVNLILIGCFLLSVVLLNAQTSVNLNLPNPCNSQDITNPEVDKESLELSIYPNPNNGEFNFKLKSNKKIGIATILIFSISGDMVYSNELYCSGNELIKPISLIHLPQGIYFVKVQSKSGIKTQKIVIQ